MIWPRSCLYWADMAANLHLVKGIERDNEANASPRGRVREERFRYPAEEEIWEVSCEPDRAERPKPRLVHDSRRAS